MGKNDLILLGLDVGNANIKAVSTDGEVTFPHGLAEMSARDIDQYSMRGELDADKSIYQVNGTYYKVGRRALEDGVMLRYGESRYNDTYYPILAAVAMFDCIRGDNQSVYVMGAHTPKDAIYRQDLITSLKGGGRGKAWTVNHRGQRKQFHIAGALGLDEPVGVWRHSILNLDGQTFRSDTKRLRRGISLVLDIGGYTTAWAMSRDNLLEYDRSTTHVNGILNVLENLEHLIRSEYRKQLKGSQKLDPMELRKSLKTDKYNAAGAGMLNVTEQVKQAVAPLMRDVDSIFERLGGLAGAHNVVLGGGGGAALESRIRENFAHPHMITADPDLDRLHYSTAYGAYKTLRLLQAKGEI